MKEYRPQKKTAEILNWAKSVIDSLKYKPSGRYVFYRVYQQFGLTKKDCKVFDGWTSRARKGFWNGWHPDILADSIREATIRGGGYDDPEEWLESFADKKCVLDMRQHQKNILEVWFEAEAMAGQFDYYLAPLRVTTVPFRGDASIPYKWEIAKRLESYAEIYPDKKIVVLYFGDYDEKGRSIPKSALRDIRAWCKVDFEYTRCAINPEQIRSLRIPEHPEKPNQYQWEAIPDEIAGKLILDNVFKFWSRGKIKEVEEIEATATKRWRETLKKEGEND